MNERQNDPPDRAVKLGFGDWSGPPLNASERTPELMKFLRLAWWVSRDGPQLDRTRSDTGMISKNFNSYASLAIFFIISVFFCFVFEHGTLYTGCETFKTWTVHFAFYLRIFVSAHVITNWITVPGMFTTFVWFFCCYLPARLFRNFTFNQRKKAREKSRKRSDSTKSRVSPYTSFVR